MSYYAIIVQTTTMETLAQVKASNNYYTAQSKANSVAEYAMWFLMDRGSGYNKSIECEYVKGVLQVGGTDKAVCEKEFQPYEGTDDYLADMKVKLTMMGRGDAEADKYSNCQGVLGGVANCYTTPTVGTGDVYEKCDVYTKETLLANKDHVCNWNKLSYGNKTLDRVSLPLYYEDNGATSGTYEIKDLFFNNASAKFALRLRAPCKPCDEREHGCSAGQNDYICADEERYVLHGDLMQDVVVQWQIVGECFVNGKNEECALLPNSTGIVNTDSNIKGDWVGSLTKIFNENFRTQNVHSYGTANPIKYDTNLPLFKKATLNIMLVKPLKSDETDVTVNNLIPYLEYQLVTSGLVGEPKTKIRAEINVNGNMFIKNIEKRSNASLIDFAVQN